MHFARKTLLGLATFFLPFCLLLLAASSSVVITLHSATKLKHWISNSGAYEKVVDAVLSQSQESAQKNGDSLPIQDPQIQTVAKTAFSPQVLQADTENVIDGTYHWLQGKTAQPDFRIDLSGPKQQFINGLGDYLRTRLASVPVCARGQVPNTDDLFTTNCIPRGTDVNAAIQQQIDKLANNKEFLGDPVITASNLKSDNNQSPFEKMKQVPKAYQKASWSPWLLGGLAVASAAIIIFVHTERRRGMKRVARIMLPTGILLIFTGVAIMQIAKGAEAQIHLTGSGVSQLQPALISIIDAVVGSLAHAYMWFGAIYALIGAGLLLAVKLWLKPTPEVEPVAKNKPLPKSA